MSTPSGKAAPAAEPGPDAQIEAPPSAAGSARRVAGKQMSQRKTLTLQATRATMSCTIDEWAFADITDIRSEEWKS